MAKGYTKYGFPIVWLKKNSPTECVEMMVEKGVATREEADEILEEMSAEKTSAVKAAKIDDTSEADSETDDSNESVDEGVKFNIRDVESDIEGFRYAISTTADTRNVILNVEGRPTFHSTVEGAIKCLAESIIRKKLAAIPGGYTSKMSDVLKICRETKALIEEAVK